MRNREAKGRGREGRVKRMGREGGVKRKGKREGEEEGKGKKQLQGREKPSNSRGQTTNLPGSHIAITPYTPVISFAVILSQSPPTPGSSPYTSPTSVPTSTVNAPSAGSTNPHPSPPATHAHPPSFGVGGSAALASMLIPSARYAPYVAAGAAACAGEFTKVTALYHDGVASL
jgi:hypothetical protein